MEFYLLGDPFPTDKQNQLGTCISDLAEAYQHGIPLLPSFIILHDTQLELSSQQLTFPPEMWKQLLSTLEVIEARMEKTFGDSQRPLLLNVRPICQLHAPPRLQSLANLGLNRSVVSSIASVTDDEIFAVQMYRKFVERFCVLVGKVDSRKLEDVFDRVLMSTRVRRDTDLKVPELWQIIGEYQELFKETQLSSFPEDTSTQLRMAIEAASRCWSANRDSNLFHPYANVLVQASMLGVEGADAGTGIALSRNPFNGQREVYGELRRFIDKKSVPITDLEEISPNLYQQLEQIAMYLEQSRRQIQQFEFIIDRGKLWVVARPQRASNAISASIRTLVDMVEEGLITRSEALKRTRVDDFLRHSLVQFDDSDKPGEAIAKGIGVAPGVAAGKAVFDLGTAVQYASRGEHPILILPEVRPEDIHGVMNASGVLAQRGGATSHAAVIARGLGIPFIVGTDTLPVDRENQLLRAGNIHIRQGDDISVDGLTGEIFAKRLQTVRSDLSQDPYASKLLKWADETRRMKVLANADTPADAYAARELGAEGIGLCRIEHMFLGSERLPLVREMICYAYTIRSKLESLRRAQAEMAKWPGSVGAAQSLEDAQAELANAPQAQAFQTVLNKIDMLLREDLMAIFSRMDGLPVTVRLLDPPLHEFLPSREELLTGKFTMSGDYELSGYAKISRESVIQAAKDLQEVNPMLGLRGVRLCILFPEIARMQVDAILRAAAHAQKQGVNVHPHILIPFISHVNELKVVSMLISETAGTVFAEIGRRIDYKIGAMIELSRAAVVAGELAKHVSFFAFGTNDLTQVIYGYSRDDAENRFLQEYIEQGILSTNPFQVIDRVGVGQLMRIAMEQGRCSNPELTIGVCGEHGGEPSSIEFFDSLGLDYLSCSARRLPTARLAAAKAVLQKR